MATIVPSGVPMPSTIMWRQVQRQFVSSIRRRSATWTKKGCGRRGVGEPGDIDCGPWDVVGGGLWGVRMVDDHVLQRRHRDADVVHLLRLEPGQERHGVLPFQAQD